MSHVDHLTLENRRLRDEIDRLQVSGLASHTHSGSSSSRIEKPRIREAALRETLARHTGMCGALSALWRITTAASGTREWASCASLSRKTRGPLSRPRPGTIVSPLLFPAILPERPALRSPGNSQSSEPEICLIHRARSSSRSTPPRSVGEGSGKSSRRPATRLSSISTRSLNARSLTQAQHS